MAKSGVNQIYDGTTWRTVEPWIYYDGQWHRAITCLYTTADGWIEFTSTSEPDTPDDSEAVWTLYDYTTFTVTSGYATDGTITWAYGWNKPEKFSNMIREEDTIIQDGNWKTDSSAGLYISMSNTKDDTLHGLHIVTTTPIVVPSTAQKLNIKYFKQSNSHIYGYVGIGLISPNETNSFNYTAGEDSYPTKLAAAENDTPVKETLSLILPDSIKGTNEYSVVVNFWAESHSAYSLPCTLYCEKIWFE